MTPPKVEYLTQTVKAAVRELTTQERRVAANRRNPPRVGFMYIDMHDARGRFWCVTAIHPDDVILKLVTELCDRPELEFGNPSRWEDNKDVCIPLAVEGYGEPVLDYNTSEWMADEEFGRFKLVAVFDSELIHNCTRQWRKFLRDRGLL